MFNEHRRIHSLLLYYASIVLLLFPYIAILSFILSSLARFSYCPPQKAGRLSSFQDKASKFALLTSHMYIVASPKEK